MGNRKQQEQEQMKIDQNLATPFTDQRTKPRRKKAREREEKKKKGKKTERLCKQ